MFNTAIFQKLFEELNTMPVFYKISHPTNNDTKANDVTALKPRSRNKIRKLNHRQLKKMIACYSPKHFLYEVYINAYVDEETNRFLPYEVDGFRFRSYFDIYWKNFN